MGRQSKTDRGLQGAVLVEDSPVSKLTNCRACGSGPLELILR
jgi:hypothetical protein